MKSIITLIAMMLICSSCDPIAEMEANIENLTSQNLSIVFASSDSTLSKSLQIDSGQSELFQEVFDVGNTYLEPYLLDYDSVLIKSQTEEILKVYKPSDSGKNIYNINDYWISIEPSKRFFIYEYEIDSEDIK